jgi:hypothetical protein
VNGIFLPYLQYCPTLVNNTIPASVFEKIVSQEGDDSLCDKYRIGYDLQGLIGS